MMKKPDYFNETCIALYVRDLTGFYGTDAVWFLVDHIRSYKTSEKSYLIRNLSDLYILIANKTDDPKHDEYWKTVLNEVQYEKYSKIGAYPLAFFKTSQDKYHDEHYVLIDFIDTLVRNNGFAEHLMIKWREHNEYKTLLPQEPISSAVKYWVRILVDMFDDGYLEQLAKNDTNNVLKWDKLLDEIKKGE